MRCSAQRQSRQLTIVGEALNRLMRVEADAASKVTDARSWYALFLVVPLMFIVSWARRHRAVHFPIGLSNVGELVIYTTRFGEHKDSGYRWTRNEISMKVRMIVAESVGKPLESIQPETKLLDLC